MVAIRRSGGVAAFHWQGKLPDPADPAFGEALQRRRFRTIEHAASEEISVGWVTAHDPTGDSFAAEDLDGGPGAWLRMRVDKKLLPVRWLHIHRAAAERSRGRRLTARERRELKDDLMEQLLPRVLPAVTLVDALLFHQRRTLLLFATGSGARETFAKLFLETFAIGLEPADPLALGLASGLGHDAERRLRDLEPMRWPDTTRRAAPRDSRQPVAVAEGEARA